MSPLPQPEPELGVSMKTRLAEQLKKFVAQITPQMKKPPRGRSQEVKIMKMRMYRDFIKQTAEGMSELDRPTSSGVRKADRPHGYRCSAERRLEKEFLGSCKAPGGGRAVDRK